MKTEYSLEIQNVSKKFPVKKVNKLGGLSTVGYKEILSDITFNVEKGTVVGVIGNNGSGKSTLFKILAGIIYPDTGTITANGKIASILELGMGFDPTLSGRDNIEIKCKLYGLNNSQISEIENKIIDFSELGEQIDYPLNTYSSGMKSKLSFSILININFDIMLIDEALSVGDVSFNYKCKNTFNSLKKQNKTLLLTSHNLTLLEELCDKLIWIESGRIKEIGEPSPLCYKFKKDSTETPSTLKQLSDNGDVSSTNRLACLYRDGISVPKNLELAKELFQKAINGGNVDALINLGDILKTEGNNENAIALYNQALQKGNQDAILRLSVDAQIPDSYLSMMSTLIDSQNVSAMMLLADAYDEGIGIKQDRNKASILYENAALHNNIKAMYLVGIRYRDGIGVEKDIEKALHFLELSANIGFLKSIVELANMYLKGIEVSVNIEKSIEYYKIAAIHGDKRSILQLNSLFRDGHKVEKDIDEANKWANLYAIRESKLIEQTLADIYYRKNEFTTDRRLAFNIYLECANKGIIESMVEVALMYRDGIGTEYNTSKAAWWFQKASDLNHDGAMFELGNMYLKGNGVERNIEKSIQLLERSAILGNKNSQYLLGRIYYEGIVVIKDLDKAINYLKLSSEKGNPNASTLLNQIALDKHQDTV